MAESLAKLKVIVDGDTAAANAAITTMQKTGTAATDRLARDFEQLRIRSEMEINLQRQSSVAAYEAIKTSGMASAQEISRAQEALQARLRSLDAAVNPGKQAIRALNNEILAMQATGTAVTDRLSKSFEQLGISSDTNYKLQRQTAIAAFEAIKTSGVASAQEISRAQEALQARLRSLDAAVNPGKQAIRALNNEIRAMQTAGMAVSDRLTPMFNQLGVRSAATIKAEMAAVQSALNSISKVGTFDEMSRGSEAARAKLAALSNELHGTGTATKSVSQTQSETSATTDSLNTGLGTLTVTVISLATAWSAYKLKELITDSTKLAARNETLGVVMHTVGNNMGYTTSQTDAYSKSVAAMGITQQQSLLSITRMNQANLDLSKSAELARVAQDAAVIGQTNSSQALEGLMHGIVTLQPEILRTYGIVINQEAAWRKYAAAHNTTSEALTQHQKQEITMQEVLNAGKNIQGAYAASLGTVGKAVYSLARYIEDNKAQFGEIFIPAAKLLVDELTVQLKELGAWFVTNRTQISEWSRSLANDVAVGISATKQALEALLVVAKYVPDVLGAIKENADLVTIALAAMAGVQVVNGIVGLIGHLNSLKAAAIAVQGAILAASATGGISALGGGAIGAGGAAAGGAALGASGTFGLAALSGGAGYYVGDKALTGVQQLLDRAGVDITVDGGREMYERELVRAKEAEVRLDAALKRSADVKAKRADEERAAEGKRQQEILKAEQQAEASRVLDKKLADDRRALSEAGLRNDLDLSKMYGQLELAQLESQFDKGLVSAQAYWERKNQLTRSALDGELELLNERQSQVENQMATEKDPEQKLKLQKQLLDLDKQRNDLAMGYNIQQVKSADERQKALAKELAFETSHLQTMQQIETAKLTALGYDQASVAVKTGYSAALLQERILQDQITTEISPRRAAQLQEQLEAQREVNRLVREQAEEQLRINQLQDRLKASTEAIAISKALGVDTKQLETDQTKLAYDIKRAELQKQLNTAKETENGLLASITSITLTQLDQLWAQKDASAAQLEQLQKILGVQQSITAEKSSQKDLTSAQMNDAIDSYNASITISRSKDEQYQHNQYISHGQGYLDTLAFYGAGWMEYIEGQAKLQMEAYEREKTEAKLIEDQKALVTVISSAADRLGSAATALANSGRDLATSLHAASQSLLNARVDLAGSNTSTLTPEQKYQMALAEFTNTAATAQSTGDVTLFNQLPDLARQLLEASQAYNASGSAFAADYDMVQRILGESATSAEAYASSAEQIVTLLEQQTTILTAIQTALQNGGDTASLLAQLNTVNQQVVGAVGNVNTSVGATTTAANATANAVWTNKSVSDAINAQVANNTSSTAYWLNSVNGQTAATASYTSRTRDVLNSSLLSSQSSGRISGETATYTYKPNSTVQIDKVTSAYSYYAAGGYYPGGSAIMGELGPEFVDSSPGYVYRADETKALFAMAKRGVARADKGSSTDDLRAVIAELKAANRSLVLTVQTLQGGLGEVAKGNKKIEQRMAGIESKARLAAAA